MYQQATIAVSNAQVFGAVKQSIDSAFSSARISEFLKSLQNGKLRIREFEEVAEAGKLGVNTSAEYKQLGDGDRGMIRELYLTSLEQVDPALRAKYLKVYAYY